MVATKKLGIGQSDASDTAARIGGGALIGGVAEWPVSPFGTALVLVASLPAEFVAEHTGIDLGPQRFASVFTTYAKGQYFLDQITYHGDAAELALLRKGTTQVLVHERGDLVHGAVEVPPHRLVVLPPDAGGSDTADGDLPNPDSLIGGEPRLLQLEDLQTDGLTFALQLYGGDLPAPFRDLFYLTDAVGYLYLPATSADDVRGLFFVQVT